MTITGVLACMKALFDICWVGGSVGSWLVVGWDQLLLRFLYKHPGS